MKRLTALRSQQAAAKPALISIAMAIIAAAETMLLLNGEVRAPEHAGPATGHQTQLLPYPGSMPYMQGRQAGLYLVRSAIKTLSGGLHRRVIQ